MTETWPITGWVGKSLARCLRRASATTGVAGFRKALMLLPSDAETHNNLAVALRALGRTFEAEAGFRRAVVFGADYHAAHNNLGNTLRALGRPAEAQASYRRALELKPDYADAHNDLGNALRDRGRLPEAQACYRRALACRHDFPEAHNNLGAVLRISSACRGRSELPRARTQTRFPRRIQQSRQHPDGASPSIRRGDELLRAIRLAPDFHEAHSNLGNALRDLGRIPEAKASYARALELAPDLNEAHSNLIFTLDLLEGCGIAEQQAERRRWYERHARQHAAAIGRHHNPPDPERKLRIGFVSADFRRHSAYYGFSPILLYHDRNAFGWCAFRGQARRRCHRAPAPGRAPVALDAGCER